MVIEYNSSFDLEDFRVQPADWGGWDGTAAFGASIEALRSLGLQKGYRLIHTDLAGVNAFFVREDLVAHFPEAAAPVIHGPNYFLQSGSHPHGSTAAFLGQHSEAGIDLAHLAAVLGVDDEREVEDEPQVVRDSVLGALHFPQSDQVIAPAIAATGVWEPSELAWLIEHVKPGSRCLNIGANVGYFVCWMSRLAGPSGRVLAVEPNPRLSEFLHRNVRTCALTNVDVLECAAGDTDGELELFLNTWNCGDGRAFDPRITTGGGTHTEHGFDMDPPRVAVPVRRLDGVLAGTGVDVVLSDTQGWDHRALRGLRETVRRRRPLILTEFVPSWIRDLGENPVDILEEYQSWGYEIGSTDVQLPERPDPWQVLKALDASDAWFMNLTLTPLR